MSPISALTYFSSLFQLSPFSALNYRGKTSAAQPALSDSPAQASGRKRCRYCNRNPRWENRCDLTMGSPVTR
jgi:hypothetical protein